jgi:hypothetical protein
MESGIHATEEDIRSVCTDTRTESSKEKERGGSSTGDGIMVKPSWWCNRHEVSWHMDVIHPTPPRAPMVTEGAYGIPPVRVRATARDDDVARARDGDVV